MSIILGIDPGSRLTGFGVIHQKGSVCEYLASGCISLKPTDPLSLRMGQLFTNIQEIIYQYQPTESAIEAVFMNQFVGAALKLGQARGALIAAIAQQDLPLSEYAPRLVKKTIVGTGAADKVQVSHMVKTLLRLSGNPQADAADALAIALCHAYHRVRV